MEQVGFFERGPGHKSMMRLIAFLGAASGMAMVLTACVLGLLVATVPGTPPEAATISTVLGPAGVAVFGLSEWMKQRQAQTEGGTHGQS